MSKQPNGSDQLRTEAETQLARASEADGTPRTAEELVHELQLHQTKLEMQNEELRQVQVELEKSRDRYVDLYDFAPVGYFTLTRDAMIAEINLVGAKLLGVERKELLLRHFAHFVSEEYRDCWNRFFVSVMQHDKRQSCELVLKFSNGSVFHAHLDCLHMKVADGEKSVRISFADMSERKKIEAEQRLLDQRLRDQQFYTRSLIESNIDALMTTDPSGIITDVNKQMEALTGCTRDELIGAPFKNYFTDPELAEAGIQLVLSEKKVTDYELTARATDGTETAVSYNATTFYDRDMILQGVFAAARDVTDRNRLDQVLREKNIELKSARAIADKANLSKSDFLSSMSHELRSPLNAILGFAQLMESDITSTAPSQKKSLAYILEAGWHLLTLINEILDLATIESGKVPLSEETVALDEVMLECRNMIENKANQRGIKLTFPQFDFPLYVRVDRTRLKQILINLLSNAIKYNSKQGNVAVTCVENTPGRVRISIEDSGAGLPPEQIAQLFQPFNRLGQDSGSKEGAGIGLVLSKQLVELMGGKIGVRSTVGVGSVFWIEFNLIAEPCFLMEEAETTALAHLPVLNQAQPHSLLYVEDNPANMQLIEDIISRYPDIQLLTAVNGHDGIEIARTSQPSVIMVDINLPGISGLEVLKILRADPITAHIPVIAISANALPLDIESGLKAGLFLYITKPIKIKEFMEAVYMALQFAEKRLEEN
jgi:PAS domain S-box-containing protein